MLAPGTIWKRKSEQSLLITQRRRPLQLQLCGRATQRSEGRTQSRSASEGTVRHSHLWGARTPGVHRLSSSNLDDPATVGDGTAGLGPTLRTGRPLVGLFFHGVSGLCSNALAQGHEKAADAGLGLLLCVSDNCL